MRLALLQSRSEAMGPASPPLPSHPTPTTHASFAGLSIMCVMYLCLPSPPLPCHTQELLDEAQSQLVEGAARLCMPVQLIRKTRSVGVVPTQPTIYEVRLWGIGGHAVSVTYGR